MHPVDKSNCIQPMFEEHLILYYLDQIGFNSETSNVSVVFVSKLYSVLLFVICWPSILALLLYLLFVYSKQVSLSHGLLCNGICYLSPYISVVCLSNALWNEGLMMLFI